MAQPLPARPNLEWLRKTAKQALTRLRKRKPEARLADAQLALAREYGFHSWRALKAYVDAKSVDARQNPKIDTPEDSPVAQFLRDVRGGEVEAVRAALAATPGLVNATGPHPHWGGRPQPLHMAIEGGNREIFDLLLANGADVHGDNAGYAYWTPLMLTIDEHPDMRAELLKRGAHIGLIEALMLGDDALVARLLKPGRKALPDYAPNGGSILAFARTTWAIDRLLELGVPIDVQDQWETTPIEAMSRLGKRGQPLMRHLIARGVQAQPAEYARLGDRHALEKLIEADPAVARTGDVLMGAVDFGHHDLAAWLLGRGADPNGRGSIGARGTPLHSAAWNGDLDMVKLLIAAGADVSARDEEYDGTPADFARYSHGVSHNPKCLEVADYLEALATGG
jgi:ankyrin repeat protein